MGKGYIHVYTGNGKGKTTAMLGLALRAAGAGLKTYIGQFIKSGEYSEVKAIRRFLPDLTLEQYGTGRAFAAAKATEPEIAAAKDGLAKAARALCSDSYDVIMLDEINVAVHLGLIPVGDALDLIRRKPPHVELVLTGRDAAPEIIEAADLVSDIAETKHYYNSGVAGRLGIEK